MELRRLYSQIRFRYLKKLFIQFILVCFFLYLAGIIVDVDELTTMRIILMIIVAIIAFEFLGGMGESLKIIFLPKTSDIFNKYDEPATLAKVRYEIDNNIVYKDTIIKISKTFLEYKDFLDEDHFVIPLNNIMGISEFDDSKTQKTHLHIVDIYGLSYYIKYLTNNKEDIRKSIKAIKDNTPNANHDMTFEDEEKMNSYYLDTPDNYSLADMFNNYDVNKLPKRKTPKRDVKKDEEILKELEKELEEPKELEKESKEPKELKELKPVIGRRSTRGVKEEKKEEPVKEEEPIVEEVEVVKPKTKRTTKTKEKDLNTKYDELKKLKELLDSNILTQEEFDKEKNKILKD